MSRWVAPAIVLLVLIGACELWPLSEEKPEGPQFSHAVYFTLKNNSILQKQKLVRDCYAYLRGHEGLVFFAASEKAEHAESKPNEAQFDVSLHMVFANRDFYAEYEQSKKHQEFIARNKDNWQEVKVFDSVIQ